MCVHLYTMSKSQGSSCPLGEHLESRTDQEGFTVSLGSRTEYHKNGSIQLSETQMNDGFSIKACCGEHRIEILGTHIDSD